MLFDSPEDFMDETDFQQNKNAKKPANHVVIINSFHIQVTEVKFTVIKSEADAKISTIL